ncbi:hypothetical protein GY065_06440 [Snodgrassella sp. ESL0323]|uniref:hypothetical protein n=1 Tax=Snodgrassella sp. ESL0323 TaxID=2705034 RepID=UPI00158274B5|nr:hypothetical protein [Snodgrassella sp. ESL0323]NUF78563.1 hypothetical protein [Snodgrassella sp. ESL0323]
MNSSSNTASGIEGKTIIPLRTIKEFGVVTVNKKKTNDIDPRDTVHDAFFHILSF